MKKVELKPGVYWVGGIDWNLRDFHGYKTQRGSTYNAYLIVDESIVLVDTVKHYLFDEMLARIKEIVDPSKIDMIVSNHVEMDHSGSISKLLEYCPNATIITSTQGEKGLRRHYKQDWNFKVVQSGDVVNIGRRNLTFVHVPMVHWPDSMVTYVAEDRILLPNDAFGQHIATAERFDDEVCLDILIEEASKYYANIVMPFGTQVAKALDALGGLDIDIIAPSHGVIWRKHIPEILSEYVKWSNHETEDKALVVYDTMWDSTKAMARALEEGIGDEGIPVTVRCLKTTDISDIMTDLIRAKLVLIGSPTINNGFLPSVGGFLTYVRGLKPKNRVGFAFGSYGWSGQSAGDIAKVMEEMKWEMPVDSKKLAYIPDDSELDEMREIGRKLARYIKKDSQKVKED